MTYHHVLHNNKGFYVMLDSEKLHEYLPISSNLSRLPFDLNLDKAQDIRVTCQDLHVQLSDITVCPANWVDERVVLTNLDDKDVVVSVTGLDALGMDGALYGNFTDLVEDLDSVPVVDGRIVIPGFYAPAERDKDYIICVTTSQTTPFGCSDNFCYTITVQDLEAPDFLNCPKEPIVVDDPAGWCNSFVNFEYPEVFENCMGLYARIEQVDITGLVSGDLLPVGLTVLCYMAINTVGNQSYCELKNKRKGHRASSKHPSDPRTHRECTNHDLFDPRA